MAVLCQNDMKWVWKMTKKKNIFLTDIDLVEFQDEDSGDFVQMITPPGEDDMKKEDIPDEVPVLPIKNTVLFPGVVIPITVGRKKR